MFSRLLFLMLLMLTTAVTSQELVVRNPYKVEAAFLRNFAHYVNWPTQAFSQDDRSWYVCVLGPDPFGDILETILEGRTEQGKPFAVFRTERLEELPSCQILFIAYAETRRRRSVLQTLRDRPVLTVGEAPEFLDEGGVIRLDVGERVSMSINLDQARSSNLKIQTKMLEVARTILENGVSHQNR
jgi:hypothetical protein